MEGDTYPNHFFIAQNIPRCCSENPQSKWQIHFKIMYDVNSSMVKYLVLSKNNKNKILLQNCQSSSTF